MEELRKPSQIFAMIAAHITASKDDSTVWPSLSYLTAAHDSRDIEESHGFPPSTDTDATATLVHRLTNDVTVSVEDNVEDEGDAELAANNTKFYRNIAGVGRGS